MRKKLDETREKARKKADQWEKKVKARMGHLKKQAASPGFALPSMNP